METFTQNGSIIFLVPDITGIKSIREGFNISNIELVTVNVHLKTFILIIWRTGRGSGSSSKKSDYGAKTINTERVTADRSRECFKEKQSEGMQRYQRE